MWFRRLSLLAPSLLAASVVWSGDGVMRAASPVLLMMFLLVFVVLLLRFSEGPRVNWDAIDVLTPVGVSTMWISAGALVLASELQWASLSVVGVLGLGTTYIALMWTVLAGSAPGRWRGSKVDRTIIPAIAVEGDALREELLFTGVRIPFGMRMFVTGRVMKHGVVSRYVVGREGNEIRLAADIGTALRGEHRPDPLEMWFGDVLGLTRTASRHAGHVELKVRPRMLPVDGARQMLGTGGDSSVSHEARKLPTEGTFRIREYVPGDDTRRIHWVRSAQQDQLIMRLPDEIPVADPAVRLVLDTELPGVADSTSRAPSELLDALVRVWLGIGKELAAAGARVTLVTAVRHNGKVQRIERSPREGLDLGTRVEWQSDVRLDALVDDKRVRQIVVTSRPRTIVDNVAWVVVPEGVWTTVETFLAGGTTIAHPFPLGSEENRRASTVAEKKRLGTLASDRQWLIGMVGWMHWTKVPGTRVARPGNGRIQLGVVQ